MTGFKRVSRGGNNRKKDYDILGLVIIIVSSFLLLCNIVPIVLGVVGEAVRSVLLGLFGVFSYVILLAFLSLGILLFARKKLYFKKRYVFIGALSVFVAFALVQTCIDMPQFAGMTYGEYLGYLYGEKVTAGGLFFGLFSYGLATSFSPVITIVILALLLIAVACYIVWEFVISKGSFSFFAKEEEPAPAPTIKKVSGDNKEPVSGNIEAEETEITAESIPMIISSPQMSPVNGLFIEKIYNRSSSAEKRSYAKDSSRRSGGEKEGGSAFDPSPDNYISDFLPRDTKSLNSNTSLAGDASRYSPFGQHGDAPKPNITMHDSFGQKGIIVPSPKVQEEPRRQRKIYSANDYVGESVKPQEKTSVPNAFTDYIPDPVAAPEKQTPAASGQTAGRRIYTSSGAFTRINEQAAPSGTAAPVRSEPPKNETAAPAPQKNNVITSSFSDYKGSASRERLSQFKKEEISSSFTGKPEAAEKTVSHETTASQETPATQPASPTKITNFETPVSQSNAATTYSPFSYGKENPKTEEPLNPFTKTLDEKEEEEQFAAEERVTEDVSTSEVETEEETLFNPFADKQFGAEEETGEEVVEDTASVESTESSDYVGEVLDSFSSVYDAGSSAEAEVPVQPYEKEILDVPVEEETVYQEEIVEPAAEETPLVNEADSLIIEDNPPIDLSETQPPVSAAEDNTGVYVKPQPESKRRKRGEPDPNQLQFEDIYETQIRFNEMIPTEDGPYNYSAPPMDMLDNSDEFSTDDDEVTKRRIELLENKLAELDFKAKVVNVVYGPSVVRFEVAPPPGKKIGGLRALAEDIEIVLCAGKIRMEIPVEGKPVAGIEVRKSKSSVVRLKDMFLSEKFTRSKLPIPIAFGVDIDGNKYIESLKSMPHLLVAGTTQSGKSVFLNTVLLSIIYKHSPEDVKLLLIDPKQVELTPYEGIPHMLVENAIFYDIKNNINYPLKAFNWAVEEMERRYSVFNEIHSMNESVNVKSIMEYNDLPEVKSGKYRKMPFIVIVVDEFADLVTNNKNELLGLIARLCAKAAACGIHMIIATQRPSTDVIDGTIKNNLPTRCAFKMSSYTDSNTVLGCAGAESLLGRGDMLLQKDGNLRRMQSPFTPTQTISDVINYVKINNECKFDQSIHDYIFAQPKEEFNNDNTDENVEDDKDSALLPQIMRMFIKKGSASASMIQTRFSLGYARSTRIIYTLENKKWVGEGTGSSKGREVLMTPSQFEEVFNEPYDEDA